MFVVFYRSGQKPGAVKVWNEGGREELRVTVNPVFIERDTNDKQRRSSLPPTPCLPDQCVPMEKRREEEGEDNKVCTCCFIGFG